jgi:putative FmdB family regulatory protein
MPIYEYECGKCGHRFEELQEMNAGMQSACPKCKGGARRLLSTATPLSSRTGSSGQSCLSRDERCGGSADGHGPCGGGKCH